MLANKYAVDKRGVIMAELNFILISDRPEVEGFLRSQLDVRSKESAQQWQKISKLEIAIERLLEDQEKMEKFFYYGVTSLDGRDNSVLAAAAWVHENRDELIKLRMEVRDLKKYVSDCSADLQGHLQKIEQREQANWQTKLAIGLALLGLLGSLGSAFVPLIFGGDDDGRPTVSTPRG